MRLPLLCWWICVVAVKYMNNSVNDVEMYQISFKKEQDLNCGCSVKSSSVICWGHFLHVFDPTAVSCKIQSDVLIVYPASLRLWADSATVTLWWTCTLVPLCMPVCFSVEKTEARWVSYLNMPDIKGSTKSGRTCSPATSCMSSFRNAPVQMSLFHTMKRQHHSSLNPPHTALQLVKLDSWHRAEDYFQFTHPPLPPSDCQRIIQISSA